MMKKIISLALVGAVLCGCATTQRVSFQPVGPGQQIVNRHGHATLTSVQPNSIVMLGRRSMETPQGVRLGYAVMIQNRQRGPLDFRFADIAAVETVAGRTPQTVQVITEEQLVREEQARQVAAAVLVGVLVGANAALAANAGNYRHTTRVHTPSGRSYVMHTTGYSPVAAGIAVANAQVANQQLVDAAVAQGQANLAAIEQQYLKDHTLMPGEWYGGLVGFAAPDTETAALPRVKEISIRVGSETHSFRVAVTPQGAR